MFLAIFLVELTFIYYINKCEIRADRLMGLCHSVITFLEAINLLKPRRITVGLARFLQWKDTFVADELLDSINRVSDASAEDETRDSFTWIILIIFFVLSRFEATPTRAGVHEFIARRYFESVCPDMAPEPNSPL